MKNYFCKSLPKSIFVAFVFISLIIFGRNPSNSEYLFEEIEIDSSTKRDENSSEIPTNPFEIVEMIRRQNSMNDATNPSDAIEEALNSFKDLEE